MGQRIRSFGYALAALTAVTAPIFLITRGSSVVGFADVSPPVLGVLLVVTALGVLATARQSATAGAAASTVALLAALLQLGQAGRQTNLLDGGGSTFSLLLALALGWAGLAIAVRAAEAGEARTADS